MADVVKFNFTIKKYKNKLYIIIYTMKNLVLTINEQIF